MSLQILGVSISIQPLIWLLLAVLFVIAEGVTTQLIAIWLALGAFAASIAAMAKVSVSAQLIWFVAVSIVTIVLTRPFLKRMLPSQKHSTNADSVIGKIALVQSEVSSSSGRVQVEGMNWSARSQDGVEIAVGSRVKVLAIEGVKLIVEPEQVIAACADTSTTTQP